LTNASIPSSNGIVGYADVAKSLIVDAPVYRVAPIPLPRCIDYTTSAGIVVVIPQQKLIASITPADRVANARAVNLAVLASVLATTTIITIHVDVCRSLLLSGAGYFFSSPPTNQPDTVRCLLYLMLRAPLVDTLGQTASCSAADVDNLVKLATAESEEQLAPRLLLAQQQQLQDSAPTVTTALSSSSSSSSTPPPLSVASSAKKPIVSRVAFAEMRAMGTALSCDSRLSSGERVGEFLLTQWSQKEQTTTAKKQKTSSSVTD
jgi:hypothetical protein